MGAQSQAYPSTIDEGIPRRVDGWEHRKEQVFCSKKRIRNGKGEGKASEQLRLSASLLGRTADNGTNVAHSVFEREEWQEVPSI